jgi:carbamoyltransferase
VAYCLSPFDEADILSLDGGGNFTFGLLAKASMGKFDLIKDLNEQNLAWLWNALAGRIFGSMDAVGKVMGLAPYGKPVYVDKLYKHFGHPMDGMTMIKMDEFPDHTKAIPFVEIGTKNENGSLSKEEENMAFSLQAITNKMAIGLLNTYIPADARSENLCISGGVALNCVMNEAIRKTGMYKNIYVPSAPNDSGLSMGFGLYLWHNILENPKEVKHWHPYRGIPHGVDEVLLALEQGKKANLKISHFPAEDEQNKAVVKLVKAQKIVGIHRGKSESGPRALGHRSIIADPSNPAMKDIINAKVKFRESFRPFAPSMLVEEAGKFLDFDGYSPYMSFAPVCHPAAHNVMSATLHVDGSARLQTVDPVNNPDFYKLIKAFYKETGIPLVLNTSLNTKGEPINETPLHSLDTLLKSDLDALLIDEYLFEK